jgi:FAS-associated factor 2
VPLLQMTLHRHQQAVADVHRRHLQRLQETELRRQQDEEYQATLAADQERDRAVALERHAEQEAAAALQNEQDEKERQASLALQAARDLILPEPSEGGTMIRFVLPSGAKINRRFVGQQTTMAAVKAFLTVYFCDSNIQIANIGLSTNFPRRTFEAGADDALTLEEAGLSPQAVLMVQDLDA